MLTTLSTAVILLGFVTPIDRISSSTSIGMNSSFSAISFGNQSQCFIRYGVFAQVNELHPKLFRQGLAKLPRGYESQSNKDVAKEISSHFLMEQRYVELLIAYQALCLEDISKSECSHECSSLFRLLSEQHRLEEYYQLCSSFTPVGGPEEASKERQLSKKRGLVLFNPFSPCGESTDDHNLSIPYLCSSA